MPKLSQSRPGSGRIAVAASRGAFLIQDREIDLSGLYAFCATLPESHARILQREGAALLGALHSIPTRQLVLVAEVVLIGASAALESDLPAAQ